MAQSLFAETTAFARQGILLRQSTIVDATLIALHHGQSRQRKRDGEMSSTKKGSNYYFLD